LLYYLNVSIDAVNAAVIKATFHSE